MKNIASLIVIAGIVVLLLLLLFLLLRKTSPVQAERDKNKNIEEITQKERQKKSESKATGSNSLTKSNRKGKSSGAKGASGSIIHDADSESNAKVNSDKKQSANTVTQRASESSVKSGTGGQKSTGQKSYAVDNSHSSRSNSAQSSVNITDTSSSGDSNSLTKADIAKILNAPVTKRLSITEQEVWKKATDRIKKLCKYRDRVIFPKLGTKGTSINKISNELFQLYLVDGFFVAPNKYGKMKKNTFSCKVILMATDTYQTYIVDEYNIK